VTSPVTDFPLLSGDEYVELYKILKVQGLVNGGGDAKHVITEGQVTVNGIEFNNQAIKIVATQ
jgi:ribosome-associated protein